jgi:hypothetical protein
VHKGVRTTGADFVTNDYHRNNIDLAVETVVDKINFEESGGHLTARSVVVVDKSGERREIKAKKEIIVSGGMVSAPTWQAPVLTVQAHIALQEFLCDQASAPKRNSRR